MRVFHVGPEQFTELAGLPAQLPAEGFLWLGVARSEFDARQQQVQAALQRYSGSTLVDLHVSDLLNAQLPSHFDTTPWYDLMVFRRLAASPSVTPDAAEPDHAAVRHVLEAMDTIAVGLVVFDRVLLSVHPGDCAVREFFAQRLAQLTQGGDARAMQRLPASPADLMLRMVNHMVDNYLELRRQLSRQLGWLQKQLLRTHSDFGDWPLLLEARDRLNLLEDSCEDQTGAVQEWIDALDEWPDTPGAVAQRERALLRLRSRDVLEHIERVLAHVRRLEQSLGSAVQMHYSALGHRTNAIMRTLTVLTAIFLPLNLITGFFGMNFDSLPLVHSSRGIWVASAMLVAVGVGLALLFWRKRYLSTRGR